ncbi:MAG: hypothetical protein ABIH59_02630 [archaeon]
MKSKQEPEEIEEDLDEKNDEEDEESEEDDSEDEEEINEEEAELINKGVRVYAKSLLRIQPVENVKIIVKLSDGTKITHEK